MESEEKKNMSSNSFGINRKYLKIKAHYFLLYAAMGGVMPFIPVMAKSLGIGATAVGIIYTVMPFCVLLSKPFFGYIAECCLDLKMTTLLLVLVSGIAYCFLFVVLISETKTTFSVSTNCSNNTEEISILAFLNNCSFKYKSIKCVLSNSNCCFNLSGEVSVDDILIDKMINTTFTENNKVNLEKSYNLTFKPTEKDITCDCFSRKTSTMTCNSDDIMCSEGTFSGYGTSAFWCFALLSVIVGTGSATLFTISDAVCCSILKEESKLYGQQRLWATIGWGTITFLAGFLNDLKTGDSTKLDFSSGFYLLFFLIVVDLIVFTPMKINNDSYEIFSWKKVWKIFSSWEIVIFSCGVYVIGALTGIIWSYQFWFLEDLGASQTLLGLTTAVQCFFAEIPFFFFSGWLIKKFGHFNCLFASLALFSLRFGLYYGLKNPWLTLPIEVFHGVTYALFYANMISYATLAAPDGTKATLMGILGGLFEGLGVATGSLLGGIGFDKFGSRKTFLCASIVSLVCVPAFYISYTIIVVLGSQPRSNNNRTSISRPS